VTGFLAMRNRKNRPSLRDLTDSNVDAETMQKESVFFQSKASIDSLIEDRIDFVPRETNQAYIRTTDYVEAVK
jgi:hypothetical protein